jgi:hypothetical protein
MSRMDAVRRLALGIIVIPVYGLLLLALLVIAIPAWIVNNLFAVATGNGLLAENSRLGYAIHVSQSNIQAAVTGRGQIEWVPV